MKIISILGSTGSIGKSTLSVINLHPERFKVFALGGFNNIDLLLEQTIKFKPSFIVTKDLESKKQLISKLKETKLNTEVLYGNDGYSFIAAHDAVTTVVAAITGSAGLISTIDAAKSGKQILLANKESMVMAGDLLNKTCSENNSTLIPVDSEHNAIFQVVSNNSDFKNIKKVILTASGGPFRDHSLESLKEVTIEEALNHPNWKMGKKISTDSATMINKVYEVIEAKKIFNISYQKIKILIHPKSYVHAILKFNNGLTNIIVHDTTMKVPIFNTLFLNTDRQLNTKKINIKILNNLDLNNVNLSRYPMVKLLNFLPKNHSLFETVIVAANDKLVELFLNNQIKFLDIQKGLFKVIKKKEFQKFKKISPKKITDITNLNDYVRSKIHKNNI